MSGAVAVLVCVHAGDTPALFDRALASIDGQDYAGGEVRIYLCVDGPVAPEIEDTIARHAPRLHRVVRNEANLGLARSLNRLLDVLGDEEFVFRMDSDDRSHARRISAQVAALQARDDVDILGTAIREVDPQGNVLRIVRYPERARDVRRFITRRNPLAHPTVCFRRRAIERFRHYPEVALNQDWALWFECLRLGLGIASLPEPLVDMTVTEDFFRRRGPRRAWDEFRILARGIRMTHGLTWRYVFPVLRLAFRLLPRPVVRLLYGSRLR